MKYKYLVFQVQLDTSNNISNIMENVLKQHGHEGFRIVNSFLYNSHIPHEKPHDLVYIIMEKEVDKE